MIKIKKMRQTPLGQRGFSLVEISVVIIIIGLILGSILSGASVIHSAKLQVVVKETKELENAIHAFETKFKYYPGDFPNAASYWPTASGDGNWQVSSLESVFVAYHLYRAGEIEREYYGGGTMILGRNIPPSTLEQGGYWFHTQPSKIYDRSVESIDVAAYRSTTLISNGILTARDAYAIDTKADDGVAATGYIYASRGDDFTAVNTCVDAAPSSATASYLFTEEEAASCRLHFWYDRKKE